MSPPLLSPLSLRLIAKIIYPNYTYLHRAQRVDPLEQNTLLDFVIDFEFLKRFLKHFLVENLKQIGQSRVKKVLLLPGCHGEPSLL